MIDKIVSFIKYNNAAVIILAIILVLGGGALAAGPEAIGEKQTSVQGIDNTALISADADAFNMDFKIENIAQDDTYYYVTYSFLDLVEQNNAWQYQLSQKTQKVSKKMKQDLGNYMAKFLVKHHEARVRKLKQDQSQAESQGRQKRIEVTAYSGLIGRTLNLAAKVFPGYEPVVKRELPAPDFNLPTLLSTPLSGGRESASGADNLTKIYNDYVAAHPELFNPITNSQTSPSSAGLTNPTGPGQDGSLKADTASSSPADAASSTPAASEPTSVKIIELPAVPDEPAPAAGSPITEPTPAPESASSSDATSAPEIIN